MEFEIQFTDLTILEANGNYKKVCEIMEKEAASSGSISFKKDWMIRSKVTILSPLGFALLVCHFYSDGKLYIKEYFPSTKDIHNTDIRCLTYWSDVNGWKTPEPLYSVIENWPEFWKKEWETQIVDCSYFDKKFGIRKDKDFRQEIIDDDEEEDL